MRNHELNERFDRFGIYNYIYRIGLDRIDMDKFNFDQVGVGLSFQISRQQRKPIQIKTRADQ
jgi:hypothetical protein